VNLQNYINAECMKTCVMTWSTVAVARDECAEARLAEEQITEVTGHRDLETPSLMRDCKPEQKALGIK
jgi:hypothetical protein